MASTGETESPKGESIDTVVREKTDTGYLEKGDEENSTLILDQDEDPKCLSSGRKWIAVYVSITCRRLVLTQWNPPF